MKSLGRIFEEVISGQERRWNEHLQQVGQQFDKLAQMAREREYKEYLEAEYNKKREHGFVDAERNRNDQLNFQERNATRINTINRNALADELRNRNTWEEDMIRRRHRVNSELNPTAEPTVSSERQIYGGISQRDYLNLVSSYVREVGNKFYVYADSPTEQGKQRQIEVFRNDETGEFFYDSDKSRPVFLSTKNPLEKQIETGENRNVLTGNLESETVVKGFFDDRTNVTKMPTLKYEGNKTARIEKLDGGGFILHQGAKKTGSVAYSTGKHLGVYPTKQLAERAREYLMRNPDFAVQRHSPTTTTPNRPQPAPTPTTTPRDTTATQSDTTRVMQAPAPRDTTLVSNPPADTLRPSPAPRDTTIVSSPPADTVRTVVPTNAQIPLRPQNTVTGRDTTATVQQASIFQNVNGDLTAEQRRQLLRRHTHNRYFVGG